MEKAKVKIVCPKCGSENVHKTQLHDCPPPIGGIPMKCDACYHTWCEDGNPYAVMKEKKEVKIPVYLMSDIETIDAVITAMKIAKQELRDKVVHSKKGLVNKIKYYFLGYILIESAVKRD